MSDLESAIESELASAGITVRSATTGADGAGDLAIVFELQACSAGLRDLKRLSVLTKQTPKLLMCQVIRGLLLKSLDAENPTPLSVRVESQPHLKVTFRNGEGLKKMYISLATLAALHGLEQATDRASVAAVTGCDPRAIEQVDLDFAYTADGAAIGDLDEFICGLRVQTGRYASTDPPTGCTMQEG